MTRTVMALIGIVFLFPSPAQGDGMACMGQHEWDDVVNGLTVPQVRTIADGPGNYGPTKSNQYSIQWSTCWRNDKWARVWFSTISDLSVDKNIVDK
jgi:hypothetical protein